MSLHVVQLVHPAQGRKVGIIEGERVHLLLRFPSVYYAALSADTTGKSLADTLLDDRSGETLAYDPIYFGESPWRLLPPFDHPDEPARCTVAGTGLTHRKGAENRNAMHTKEGQGVGVSGVGSQALEVADLTPIIPPSPPLPIPSFLGGEEETVPTPNTQHPDSPLTDSMKIYEWGVSGGKPEPGTVGVQPEWFYKGNGTILRAHNEPLDVPNFAEDGGEEPELVGVYFIDSFGSPRRVGFCVGNEFSDHVMEKRNYLYLAPSKLRNCAMGPELILGDIPEVIPGTVKVTRGESVLWETEIATGFGEMVHSRENLEHHHFKYPAHRRAGDVHLHFFGTGAFSFGAGIALEDGDVMQISLEGFGRPLVNPLRKNLSPVYPTTVTEI